MKKKIVFLIIFLNFFLLIGAKSQVVGSPSYKVKAGDIATYKLDSSPYFKNQIVLKANTSLGYTNVYLDNGSVIRIKITHLSSDKIFGQISYSISTSSTTYTDISQFIFKTTNNVSYWKNLFTNANVTFGKNNIVEITTANSYYKIDELTGWAILFRSSDGVTWFLIPEKNDLFSTLLSINKFESNFKALILPIGLLLTIIPIFNGIKNKKLEDTLLGIFTLISFLGKQSNDLYITQFTLALLIFLTPFLKKYAKKALGTYKRPKSLDFYFNLNIAIVGVIYVLIFTIISVFVSFDTTSYIYGNFDFTPIYYLIIVIVIIILIQIQIIFYDLNTRNSFDPDKLDIKYDELNIYNSNLQIILLIEAFAGIYMIILYDLYLFVNSIVKSKEPLKGKIRKIFKNKEEKEDELLLMQIKNTRTDGGLWIIALLVINITIIGIFASQLFDGFLINTSLNIIVSITYILVIIIFQKQKLQLILIKIPYLLFSIIFSLVLFEIIPVTFSSGIIYIETGVVIPLVSVILIIFPSKYESISTNPIILLPSLAVNIGNRKAKKGEYEKAIQVYKIKKACKPKDWKIHYQLSICYFLLGQMTAAQELAEKALILEPNYADAFLILTQVKLKEKNEEHALKLLSAGFSKRPYYEKKEIYFFPINREIVNKAMIKNHEEDYKKVIQELNVKPMSKLEFFLREHYTVGVIVLLNIITFVFAYFWFSKIPV